MAVAGDDGNLLAVQRNGASRLVMAVARRVHELLVDASISSAYRATLELALHLPGHILSASPRATWAHLIGVSCIAAGGSSDDAVPFAAAAELFMLALDILDDVEDGEASPALTALGQARALNVSTGLLFLAQRGLGHGANPSAMDILLTAGLRACGGQDADLAPPSQAIALDDTLAVTAEKSASLAAALCRLGALAAGSSPARQDLFARFGWHLGLIRQLHNDIAALHPALTGKTDIALHRPTLPLTCAALLRSAYGDTCATSVAMHLAWAIAETYRCHAMDLLPLMTTDPKSQALLARLLAAP